MSNATAELAVGDCVDSPYGVEHRGTIIHIGRFKDGGPMYHVKRASDGFVWVGMCGTVVRLTS